jgi:hypothetical protein
MPGIHKIRIVSMHKRMLCNFQAHNDMNQDSTNRKGNYAAYFIGNRTRMNADATL